MAVSRLTVRIDRLVLDEGGRQSADAIAAAVARQLGRAMGDPAARGRLIASDGRDPQPVHLAATDPTAVGAGVARALGGGER
jgi:hypothetical protein